MSDDDTRIAIARIGAAHGIRGEVRIKPYGDDPLSVADYGPLFTKDGSRSFEILDIRPHKNVVIARIKGVNDRNAAEALNGVVLHVARQALPEPEDEDEFYHADLLGLAAVDVDGAELGTIVTVPNFGAGDLLEIAPQGGRSFYVPFTREFVPTVDLDAGRVVVDLPEDYLSESDEDKA